MAEITPICNVCLRNETCDIRPICSVSPKLNLGSGLQPLKDYINFDAQVLKGIQSWDNKWGTDVIGMVQDITEIFPINYFNEVYAAHMIEHLFYEEAIQFVKDIHHILKVKGKIVLEGPDVLGVYKWFTERRDIPGLIECLYPYKTRMEYGPLMQHKSGWTKEVLAEFLAEYGYTVIYSGVGHGHGMPGHDFRVEAIKWNW